ncbi:dihydroxyacetone kinase subunit DhaK, partial [Streptomyces mirabilis]|uniref:dihydroxyacetone kinase subunit DhaK n=1 Tax=Streptomyces mirabilis TaxID=68239 RepID=UPI0033E160C1
SLRGMAMKLEASESTAELVPRSGTAPGEEGQNLPASAGRASQVGEYCTSLDMAGVSVTLVRLDDEISELLAAPAEIPIRVF